MLANTIKTHSISVAEILPERKFLNCDDILLKSCRSTFHNIQPGDLYVAFEDPCMDSSGVEEAIRRHACGVVVREDHFSIDQCPVLRDFPLCLTPNPHTAYARICQALYKNPSELMQVIGVTGSRGKRIVCYLIGQLLYYSKMATGIITQQGVALYGGSLDDRANEEAMEQASMNEVAKQIKEFMVSSSQGLLSSSLADSLSSATANVASESGKSNPLQVIVSNLTNLPPKKTAYWLSHLNQMGCTSVVIEAPQNALDKSNLAGIHFDVGCVTRNRPYKSAGQSYGSFREGADKQRPGRSQLIDAIKKPGYAIVNADDSFSRDILLDYNEPALTFGTSDSAQVKGVILEQYLSEQICSVTAGEETKILKTPIIGEDYLSYCLCAISAGLTFDMKLNEIVGVIESVTKIPGYMQFIDSGRGYQVFLVHGLDEDDDSLPENLKTIHQLVSGRLILVLDEPNSPNANEAVLAFNNLLLAKKIDRILVVNSESGLSAQDKRQALLFKQLSQKMAAKVELFEERQEAINSALDGACQRDCVVIAGNDSFFSYFRDDYDSDEASVQQYFNILSDRETRGRD